MFGCQCQHLRFVQSSQSLDWALRVNDPAHGLLVEEPQLRHCLLFQLGSLHLPLADQSLDQICLVCWNAMCPLVRTRWIVLDAPARHTLGDGHDQGKAETSTQDGAIEGELSKMSASECFEKYPFLINGRTKTKFHLSTIRTKQEDYEYPIGTFEHEPCQGEVVHQVNWYHEHEWRKEQLNPSQVSLATMLHEI